jgi:hypothetical protein
MATKVFLRPSVAGFAARTKQRPEDFVVTEVPAAEAAAAAGHPPPASRSDEPVAKRPRLEREGSAAAATARGTGAPVETAAEPNETAAATGPSSSEALLLPLPEQASLLASSPFPLPACCAIPSLRTHRAALGSILDASGAEALAAFAAAVATRFTAAAAAAAPPSDTQPPNQAGEAVLGTVAKADLRGVHHGVKMLYPWCKSAFLCCFQMQKRSFCQDRLGTTTRKTQQIERRVSQARHAHHPPR